VLPTLNILWTHRLDYDDEMRHALPALTRRGLQQTATAKVPRRSVCVYDRQQSRSNHLRRSLSPNVAAAAAAAASTRPFQELQNEPLKHKRKQSRGGENLV
jgi:hypothetical protein